MAIIKEKLSLKKILKNLKKNDYFTIIIFMIGFSFAAFDMKINSFILNIISLMNAPLFWLFYLITIISLSFTVKSLIKWGSVLRIKEDEGPMSFSSFKLFFIGYYLGFIINFSNVFVIDTFRRYLSF